MHNKKNPINTNADCASWNFDQLTLYISVRREDSGRALNIIRNNHDRALTSRKS